MRAFEHNQSRSHPWLRRAFMLLGVLCAIPGIAAAVDFPVSGTMTVNGNGGALPAGGKFAGSSYAPANGAIAAGAFTFPQATANFSSPLGPAVATYQVSQIDTSAGQVATDGVAALTNATMKLQVLQVTAGVLSIPVGTCIFQPINVLLTGTGSVAGLDLSDSGFVIPPVGPNDCGNLASQINSAIAGNNNSMQVHLAGDFTPPASGDTIFVNGFDPPGA